MVFAPLLQTDTVNKLKETLQDGKLRGVILHNYPREQNHIEQFNQNVSFVINLKILTLELINFENYVN